MLPPRIFLYRQKYQNGIGRFPTEIFVSPQLISHKQNWIPSPKSVEVFPSKIFGILVADSCELYFDSYFRYDFIYIS